MEDLKQLEEILGALPSVKLAVVFGSRARGRHRSDSDLDLGLLVEPDTPAIRREVEAAVGRAAPCEVDIVHLAEAPPLLRFQIARDGMTLLERDERAWPRFKARAMVEWWDWAPTLRKIQSIQLRRLKQQAREQVSHGGP